MYLRQSEVIDGKLELTIEDKHTPYTNLADQYAIIAQGFMCMKRLNDTYLFRRDVSSKQSSIKLTDYKVCTLTYTLTPDTEMKHCNEIVAMVEELIKK